MKIDYLGHSEFVLNIENKNWETVKIMSDSWLSNYAFWDMMQRNPKIKLDYEKIQDLDAIFLSHSHCDHIDPYTLIDIYKAIKPRPLLLIPETIEFLVPLFRKYLEKQKIHILRNKEIFNLKWIELYWIVFENNYLTNEDDVMTLSISNEKELVFVEVDTIPPDTYKAQETLHEIFTRKDYDQTLYLATRNELEWNLKLLDFNNVSERKKFAEEYIEYRKEEINYQYERFENELYWAPDIHNLKSFSKAFIGQWIICPSILSEELQEVKILDLKQELDLEKEISENLWKSFPISYLKAWKSYELKNKQIKEIWEINYIKEINHINKKSNLDLEVFKKDKFAPLNNEKRNTKKQEAIILEILNNKFLPYRMANLEDPLKNIILNTVEKNYVVKIRYGNSDEYIEKNYRFDFSKTAFEIEKSEHKNFHEDYWANDLEDFYSWTQELYTNFLHKLDKTKAYRVWTCLWANFLNNDIVYKKFDFHFKRAFLWKNVDNFVEKYLVR